MTGMIPDSHRDLLERPIYVTATTIMPDSQPQSTVVWWDGEGAYVRINTARGRQKDKNLAVNPRITILALDPDNPFRWLEVRGIAEEITTEGAVDHIHALSLKYTGRRYYGETAPAERESQETRLLIKIRPTKVLAFPSGG